MNRRTYLASALALSGLGAGALAMNDPDSDAGDQPLRHVELLAVDDVPDRFGTTMAVDVLAAEITTERTVRIRVTATNETDERQRFATGPDVPFSGRESSPAGWWLYDDGTAFERVSETCWEPNTESSFDHLQTNVARYLDLEPGESRTQTFELWSDPAAETDECMPTGTYRFQSTYDAYGEDRYRENPDRFTWGFELGIERPNTA